jgi:hypothetical protein
MNQLLGLERQKKGEERKKEDKKAKARCPRLHQ